MGQLAVAKMALTECAETCLLQVPLFWKNRTIQECPSPEPTVKIMEVKVQRWSVLSGKSVERSVIAWTWGECVGRRWKRRDALNIRIILPAYICMRSSLKMSFVNRVQDGYIFKSNSVKTLIHYKIHGLNHHVPIIRLPKCLIFLTSLPLCL